MVCQSILAPARGVLSFVVSVDNPIFLLFPLSSHFITGETIFLFLGLNNFAHDTISGL